MINKALRFRSQPDSSEHNFSGNSDEKNYIFAGRQCPAVDRLCRR
ncbi:Uncharacterised protein [Shigella sonnei]|nr:Uncharacterised protein [Shigella sonnei]